MAHCSKEEKLQFLNCIGSDPTINEMLEYVLKCRPTAFWNKELKRPKYDPTIDKDELLKLFMKHSDPDEIDSFEVTWQKDQKKKNETYCKNCSKFKLNVEFRFNDTCCLCRNSTIEEDDVKQEWLSNSQVCSTCHCRLEFSKFKKRNESYMKTCIDCVNKKKKKKAPEITPEPPHPVHDSETEHPNPQYEAKTEVSE